MNREARPAQPQLIGNHGRNTAALTCNPGSVFIVRLHGPRIVQQGFIKTIASRHKDRGLWNLARLIAGILNGLPGVLQQHPKLRIHKHCIFG